MTITHKRPLYIRHAGPVLLDSPLLNKASAFTRDERRDFNLTGLLPYTMETIEEQAVRAYNQYLLCTTDIERHIYLRSIQDDNETLFYRLVEDHLDEMLPIIYTPTVGQACQEFSKIYRNHRGIFVSYPDKDRIDDIIHCATKKNVKVIVVSDCERILGLGDQGVGGMGIPIGKLSLYTSCWGISPAYTLPIVLDVGTNNPDLLKDPMYMGWRHERISGDAYYEFVDLFVQAVLRRWPKVLLQFEDFAQHTALPLLEKYRDKLCCFNDDIQGTAAVAVGTLWAACKAKGEKLSDQTVTFLGAGSAGCGIAEQIVSAMVMEGLTEEQARQRVFMVDRWGLITDEMTNLPAFQQRLAQKVGNLKDWQVAGKDISLLETVQYAKPTVLVGVSAQRGLFTEEVIKTMHKYCAKPLVMPLSNPTSKIEATPQEILNWTNGEALVATGSPFTPVHINGKEIAIAQCNNSYIFPGVGLGVLSSKAVRVTERMMMVAAEALAACSPIVLTGEGAILPAMKDIQEVSKKIAFAVAKQAQKDKVALEMTDEQIQQSIEKNFWKPEYREYRRASF